MGFLELMVNVWVLFWCFFEPLSGFFLLFGFKLGDLVDGGRLIEGRGRHNLGEQ